MTPPVTWILTEGLAGTEAPCRGLARALGVDPVIKRVRIRHPWDWLPGRLWIRPFSALAAEGDRLAPPWPDLLISSGNAAAPLALSIKRASGGATRIVHIQTPRVGLRQFDLVVAPQHDGTTGPNVLTTRATLHGLDTAALDDARAAWAPVLGGLGRPLVALLCGGSNGRFELGPREIGAIAASLRLRMRRDGIGLAVSASRRTGAANTALLRAELAPAGAFVWDGQPPNPYLGMLAHADAIAVTQDSVSMLSEAIGTGKPVYWIALPGRSRRLQLFVDLLTRQGVLRRFPADDAPLETWRYAPPDDTARTAAEIGRRFGWTVPAAAATK
jgi:mitochondrial fission protein ELM1